MKSVIMDKASAARAAAERVKEIILDNPKAVIAAAGGRSTMNLYRELVKMCENEEVSFEKVSVFLVADFERAPLGKYMKDEFIEEFIDRIDISDANVYYLNSLNYKLYDEVIEAKGGIDLCILGLGDNCHIGFNEPATPFVSTTHAQRLAPATRRQYAYLFGSEEAVPENGLTMGIKTLFDAKEQLVLAFGEEKQEAVFKMFYGRNDSRYPAAFLQIPPDVTVYLDEAAAEQLVSGQPVPGGAE